MKKITTLLTVVLLIVISVIVVGCGGSSVVGRYKLKYVYRNSRLFEIGDKLGYDKLEPDSAVLELFSDNTLEFVWDLDYIGDDYSVHEGIWVQESDFEFSGYTSGGYISWTKNGNNIIIYIGSSSSGDCLILTK